MNANQGYVGWSMSVRASDAYSQGEKPISKFKKSDVEAVQELFSELNIELKNRLTVKGLKEFLKESGPSSWHHTSKFYNATDFYSVANALTDGMCTDLCEITDDEFDTIKKMAKVLDKNLEK